MAQLYNAVRRMTADPQEAEDLVQDTYQRAFQAYRQLKGPAQCRAWLYQIMRNLFIDAYRRKRTMPELVLVEGGREGEEDSFPTMNTSAEEEALRHLSAEEIRKALASLPEEMRTELVLCDIEGFTYQEIAEIVGCPLGTVRSRIARAPFYPQVGASVIETSGALRVNALLRPSGSLIQPNQDNFIGGLSASQLLYDFGQTAHRVEANRLTARALGDDLLTQKANVILNVQHAYYEGLKRKRLVPIAEDTVHERGIIKQQVDSLYRQQLKSKLDVDLVQVELSKAEVDLIRAKNDLWVSYAALNNAMGVEGPEEYTLEDLPVTVSETRSLDGLLAVGQEQRPELLAIRERIRAAEQKIKAANSQNFPIIQAVGSAGDAEQFSGRPSPREGG